MAPAVRTLFRPLVRLITVPHEASTSLKATAEPASTTQDCSVTRNNVSADHSPVIGMLIGFVICSVIAGVFLR